MIAKRELVDHGHLAESGLALVDACERAGRPGAARALLESALGVAPAKALLGGEHIATRLAWARLLAKVGRAGDALEIVAQNIGKRAGRDSLGRTWKLENRI